eukprot:16444380-Heterocapsa_arctica.AAC.1
MVAVPGKHTVRLLAPTRAKMYPVVVHICSVLVASIIMPVVIVLTSGIIPDVLIQQSLLGVIVTL